MNNWKPISTAPKDRPILLVYRNYKGEKTVVKGGFDESKSSFKELVDLEYDYSDFRELYTPATHWLELPTWPLPPTDDNVMG